MIGLAFGLLAGPVSMLWMQSAAFSGVPWGCWKQRTEMLHLIPAAFLVVALAALGIAVRDWRRVGGGSEADGATVADRTRFIAICGIVASAFSAMVIVGMWIPLFTMNPCQW